MFENNQNTLFEGGNEQNLVGAVDSLISSYTNLKEENEKLKIELDAIKEESMSTMIKSKDELDKLETIVLEQEQEKDDIFAKISRVLGE